MIFIGMSGEVVLDDNADREPDYWLWHFGEDMEQFEHWTDINMTDPPGEVCTM